MDDEFELLLSWFRAHLGLPEDQPLPLLLDVPVAGKAAGFTSPRSYRAAKSGFMPTVVVSGRSQVPTLAWLRKLSGKGDARPAPIKAGKAA
jgi:hypothetical protein